MESNISSMSCMARRASRERSDGPLKAGTILDASAVEGRLRKYKLPYASVFASEAEARRATTAALFDRRKDTILLSLINVGGDCFDGDG